MNEHNGASLLERRLPNLRSCRPLLKWPGGKRSELSWIRPLIPRHERYFEPFFGGGSVFFDAIDAPAFANDLHPDLMNLYHCVQQQSVEFFSWLHSLVHEWERGTQHDREQMYYCIRDRYNAGASSAEQRAADFFLLRQLAYGGMFRLNAAGDFNVPFGRAYAHSDGVLRGKADYLSRPGVRAKMALLTLYTLDFEEFLNEFRFGPDDFVFLDPPYDTSFSKYHQTDFDSFDQERLAQALEGLNGKFMLVCKRTPTIEALYLGNGYHELSYEFRYRFNIKGRFSRNSEHLIITNYGEPDI